MSEYKAITRTEFANLTWQRLSSYNFAAKDAVVQLVVKEMPRICTAVPIAFIPHEQSFVPVAVQGLRPEQNLFVRPDGHWIAPYVPAYYRAYPFKLASTDANQLVLCIDMESGLVGEGYSEYFFDEQGELTKTLIDILKFQQEVYANREATQRICAVLQQNQLIEPWPITVANANDETEVQGLYRINEEKFNSLDIDALYDLQQAGALPVIYCQLISMQHIQNLARLAYARNNTPVVHTNKDINLDFLSDGQSLNFGRNNE